MKKVLVMITMFLSFTTAFAQGICGANVLINFDASSSVVINNTYTNDPEVLDYPDAHLHPRMIPLESYLSIIPNVRETLNINGRRDRNGNFSHQLGVSVLPKCANKSCFFENRGRFISQWIYNSSHESINSIKTANLKANFIPYLPSFEDWQNGKEFTHENFLLGLYQNINTLIDLQIGPQRRQKNILVFISDFDTHWANPFSPEIRNFPIPYLYQNSQLGPTELILIQARNPENLDQSRMEHLAAQLKIPERNIFIAPPKPQAKFIWSKDTYNDLIDAFLIRLIEVLPACA